MTFSPSTLAGLLPPVGRAMQPRWSIQRIPNNGYPVLYCLGKVCLIPKIKIEGTNRATETHLTRHPMAMGP